jgi:hypothetical protein
MGTPADRAMRAGNPATEPEMTAPAASLQPPPPHERHRPVRRRRPARSLVLEAWGRTGRRASLHILGDYPER